MKVLQMVPEMKMGGVETGTLDLAQYLIEKGHESLVMSAGGPMVESLSALGARHIELPIHRKSLFSIIRLTGIVRRIIQEEKIDIVHARSRVPAWIAFFAVRGTEARFVTTAHGYYRPHFFSRVMSFGERVIAISHSIQDHLMQNFSVPRDRIRLIHRGVRLQKFKYEEKMIRGPIFRVGMVARVTRLKGHEIFLDALALLKREGIPIQGVMIGSVSSDKKNYYESLIQKIKSLGLENSVSFETDVLDIAHQIRALDILILPTTTPEAFGRVIIEAQALGVPVIAASVGGVVDIIEDGRTGWLVAPGDSEALANKIREVLDKRDGILHIVKGARQRVEKEFDLHKMGEKTLAVYQDVLKSPRILVIKLGAIGDIILVSPTLRAIRDHYPDADISILTQESKLFLFKNCPYINHVIPVRPSFRLTLREIRLRRFDILIDLQNNKKSHILGFLSRIPQRVGFGRNARGWMLTDQIEYSKSVGPIESQKRLMALLGISVKEDQIEFWPSSEEIRKVQSQLLPDHSQKYVGFFPFSNARWLTKRWPQRHFIQLAQKVFDELHLIPIFVGAPEDASREWDEALSKLRCVNLIGKTSVGELYEVIKRCTAFVSGDSAPLHIAAAAETPVTALFGPTDARRHAVPGRVIVLSHDISCAPCYSPRCKIKTHDCMEKISVDRVFEEVSKVCRLSTS